MTTFFEQAKKALSVMFCAVAIVGCGSGGGEEEVSISKAVATVKETTAFIEGRAVKGLVVNGVVNAYEIEFQNGRWVKSSEAVTESVRTNSDGRYQIALTGDSVGREYVVEVTADAQTTMRCELVNGCTDIESAAFGDYFSPSTDFVISTITPIISADRTTTAHVSMFTHLARSQAEASAEGLGQQSFNEAVQNVEQMFALESGVTFREPIDLADISELNEADAALAEAGVLAAAFHEIAAQAEWESISAVVNHAAERMSQQGSLSIANMGALSDVALDDVFYAGQVVATEFATTAGLESGTVSLMETIESGFSSDQQLAMDEAASITPVQIISQPVSQQVDSGTGVTLSVGVIGTGPISYQWFKNGGAIAGANSSSYTINSAVGGDAGEYSVVVTNSVGSVQSAAAALGVTIITHDVTLSWDIPTEREDGSALALYEINGYVIKYGSSANALDNEIEVVGGGQTSQVIEGLEAGSYYFVIATVDSDNVRGRFSNAVNVQVN